MSTLYRVLLLAFPADFRRRFGDDMAAVFADRLHGARKRGGTVVMALLWRTVLDTTRHGLGERRAARRAAAGRTSMLGSLLQDVRFAIRTLATQPGLTAAAVATLAIGIGATTAVYSIADALMLRPLPYPNAERIVSIEEVNAEEGFSGNVAVPNFDDWRAGVDAIEAGAAWTTGEVNLAGVDGAERVSAGAVTGEFFDIVGVTPIAGRVFGDDAREPGFETVVVLSEGAWSRLYGRAAEAIGRTAVLDGVASTVVGVVPAVAGLEHVEVWKPLARTGAASARTNHAYRAYIRLRPDVTVEQASAQFNVVAERLEAEYGDTNAGWRVALTPLHEQLTVDFGETVTQVAGIVGLLLLIACTNVAGLLMSRVTDRRAEFAVRAALGAGRARIVRQVLTECVVLSLTGAAVGVLLAWWSTGALTRVLVSDDGVWRTPGLSMAVLAFATAVAIAAGLLFGLAPALMLRSSRAHDGLRGATASAGRGSRRVRSGLAFVQLAMASLLLVGAAMLLSGLYRTLQIDPGFDPENVMAFTVTPPAASYGDGAALTAFYTSLTDRLLARPQVASVGAMSSLPMAGNSTIRRVVVPGRAPAEDRSQDYTLYQVSTPGYVAASGMRLVAGRDFTAADGAGGAPVALVNESLARRLWPDGGAVGRQILAVSDENTPREVVGLLADIRYRGLDRPILPQYFVPFAQAPRRTMSVTMRLSASLPLEDVRETVASLDPALPVYQVTMLEDLMRRSLAERRALTTTVALFGLVAVSLAAIGLHGIMAAGVRERRREIGIRMAVGADAGRVRGLFLRQGLLIAAAAVATGFAASSWLIRGSQEIVIGLEAPGPWLFAGVAVFVLAIALAATWLPARLATRIDPVTTLRT